MKILNKAKKVITIMLALALVFTLTPAIPGAVENAYAADGDSYLREKNEKFKQIAKLNRANKR